jgi:hypothetical protein
MTNDDAALHNYVSFYVRLLDCDYQGDFNPHDVHTDGIGDIAGGRQLQPGVAVDSSVSTTAILGLAPQLS